MVYGVAYLRCQERDLRRRLHVAAEEDYAARLDFAEELAHAPVKLRSRNAYEEHTTGLALNRQFLFNLTLFRTLRHQLKVPFSSKEETPRARAPLFLNEAYGLKLSFGKKRRKQYFFDSLSNHA